MTELQSSIKSLIVESLLTSEYDHFEVSELHHNLFNQDYWVIGSYKASQEILKHCDVFEAIGIVKDYELSIFGEINTDLSEAERVCNMLTYILSEDMLNSYKWTSDHWDTRLTPEIRLIALIELEEIKLESPGLDFLKNELEAGHSIESIKDLIESECYDTQDELLDLDAVYNYLVKFLGERSK